MVSVISNKKFRLFAYSLVSRTIHRTELAELAKKSERETHLNLWFCMGTEQHNTPKPLSGYVCLALSFPRSVSVCCFKSPLCDGAGED